MDLFNSQVIKSAKNPNGVDMGTQENIEAISIVSSNILTTGINTKKSEMISENKIKSSTNHMYSL